MANSERLYREEQAVRPVVIQLTPTNFVAVDKIIMWSWADGKLTMTLAGHARDLHIHDPDAEVIKRIAEVMRVVALKLS